MWYTIRLGLFFSTPKVLWRCTALLMHYLNKLLKKIQLLLENPAMATDIAKALKKEQYKHDLFPWLLKVREECSTWTARAEALNKYEIPTYSGVAWTRQNVERLFKSYWTQRNGRYSHKEHADQIKAIETSLAA